MPTHFVGIGDSWPLQKMCQGERGHTPSRGAPCQYLAGGADSPRLLPTGEAEVCPLESC